MGVVKCLMFCCLSFCLLVSMTQALNPVVGIMNKGNQGYGGNRRPWDSNVYRPRGLTNDDYGFNGGPKPWNRQRGREVADSDGEDEKKPCVGLCYTLKLLKLAEQEAKANERAKRFDGYLYDFY
eukprot:TRINITY_DN6341_c0_g1_i2.p1 TRINITY_DN6341_c0_g1~~TRINITY_DN6341_c0_g1_i2.p1  ORF type:complete len:124 (-),score=13.99 TRINITY_DN6341_c0_g1_i2:172-543(-)